MKTMIPGGTALAIAILAAFGPLGATSALARAKSVEEAKAAAPLLELEKRTPETFTLKNGMKVWYLRNERLPLVNVRAVVRAGRVWEPADRQGVAGLTGRMLRVGGTATRSPEQVDEDLDFLAADLTSAIGSDQGNVSLDVLTANLEPALAIFADVLRNAAFAEGRLDVQKNLQKEEIRRENDSPIQVAFREYLKLVWGAKHPRARTPTEESVDALTRDDLVAFHANFFRPSNVLLAVTGDVPRKTVEKMLNRSFGDWKPAGETVFPDLPPTPAVEPRVALAEKDVPQSTVILGHLGPREDDPNRGAGEVMMEILGAGGFTSWIVDRVRNDEGLAYFAGGFLQFGRLDSGNMMTLAMSKAETTCRAADLILEQIERMRSGDIPEEDLTRARDAILNSQAFEWDSPDEVVARFLDLVYYGLPADHDERVLESIGRVTREDVHAAALSLLHPDRLTAIAVGNPAKMDCDWGRFAEELGVELQKIDLE
ncbi:MAG: pitrilysin family protein [bacterium]